jgi:predicted cation transporter
MTKSTSLILLSVAMGKICREIFSSSLWLTDVLHNQNMCVLRLIPIEIQQVVLFIFMVFFVYGRKIHYSLQQYFFCDIYLFTPILRVNECTVPGYVLHFA